MSKLTVVTGNPEKLAELRRLIPVEFEHQDLDLPEIQSLDLDEIIADKAKRAYDILRRPVLVEDVSAELESLNGLPGPFIKFFNQRLGQNSLYKLGGDSAVTLVKCVVAFYNGQRMVIGHGEVPGKVVPPRTKTGFGFERVFVPDGYEQTFAEMADDLKDSLSHRGRAIRDLLQQVDL